MEGAEYLSDPVERQTKIRRQGIRGVFQSTALLLILNLLTFSIPRLTSPTCYRKDSPTSWWISNTLPYGASTSSGRTAKSRVFSMWFTLKDRASSGVRVYADGELCGIIYPFRFS